MRAYQKERAAVSKQLKNLRSRMEAHPEGKEQYQSEAATLDALKEKQEEYQNYLSDLRSSIVLTGMPRQRSSRRKNMPWIWPGLWRWPGVSYGELSCLLPTRRN